MTANTIKPRLRHFSLPENRKYKVNKEKLNQNRKTDNLTQLSICTNLEIRQPVGVSALVTIPLNLPRHCNDFAFRNIASNSNITACMDIGGAASLCERLLQRSPLLARVSFILGATAAISIPSNTCRAASMFPF